MLLAVLLLRVLPCGEDGARVLRVPRGPSSSSKSLLVLKMASISISDSMRKRIKIVCGVELVYSFEVELSLLVVRDLEYMINRREQADIATR